jgi:flavodoxin
MKETWPSSTAEHAARGGHTMIKRKRMLLFAALAAAVVGIAAFAVMMAKDQTYVSSAPYTPQGEPNRDVAVVYYSRSGHSEAVAREIARTFNAPIARIDADYPRSFSGQSKAVSDARGQALAQIRVERIELAPARRVFLVSPTWMFRPATPLWAYVEQTDLIGKEVVLVSTGNSRFEQVEIDAFAKRVEARGGRLIRHVFLLRGRIFWQMSREELLKAVRAEMDAFR